MQIGTEYPLTRYLAGRLPDRLARRFLLIAGIVGLPVTLVVSRTGVAPTWLPVSFNDLVLGVAGLIVLLAPATCAASAAMLTMRRLRDPAYQLLQLTAVSPRRLVQGHVRAALLNLRGLLAVVAGLTPALAAGMVRLSGQWTARPYPYFSPFGLTYRQPWSEIRFVVWRIDRLGWHPEFHAWLIGTWGAILLGVTLGVWLARWWRSPIAAGVVVLPLLAMAAGPLVAIPYIHLEHIPLAGRVLLVAAYGAGPYGLAWLAGRGAAR
jgi:hypothetical protein